MGTMAILFPYTFKKFEYQQQIICGHDETNN